MYEVGFDEFGKNKIIEYKLTKHDHEDESLESPGLKKLLKQKTFSFSPYRRQSTKELEEEKKSTLPENVLAVYPFNDELKEAKDLNMPGLNWKLNCLTNYHDGKVENITEYKWMPNVKYKKHATSKEMIEENKKNL